MTDLPNSSADPAANASTPADPELAALVRPWDADPSPAAVDAVPVVPMTAVNDDEPPARPRRRRSLALRFGISFVAAFVLALGIGGGVLYAWGQQYDGLVMPGVRIGSTELGGLTRDQAGAAIANAYGSLGTGQITLTGPDGQTTTLSYADVGRGPDISPLVDAAFAAGRQGDPLVNLIGAPRAAINGVTLDPAVAYDRDKLSAAVDTLATTIDQTPVDATVSASQGGSFSVTPAKDGRAVDKTALLTALDAQLASLGAPASITADVPVVALPPAVPTDTADGSEGGRGSDGRRRGRHAGQGQLDDRRQEPRAAHLVHDGGRREHHSGR